jgi:hypothetical protein
MTLIRSRRKYRETRAHPYGAILVRLNGIIHLLVCLQQETNFRGEIRRWKASDEDESPGENSSPTWASPPIEGLSGSGNGDSVAGNGAVVEGGWGEPLPANQNVSSVGQWGTASAWPPSSHVPIAQHPSSETKSPDAEGVFAPMVSTGHASFVIIVLSEDRFGCGRVS